MAKNLPIRGNQMSGMDQILDKPRCRIFQTIGQTVANATVTAILWDVAINAVEYDTDGFYSSSLQTRVTIRTAGTYDVKAHTCWVANAAGVRYAWIQKNGSATTRYATDVRTAPAVGDPSHVNIATSMLLSAGDYLELMAYQTTGGNLATQTNGNLNPCAEILLCLIST